MQKKSIDVTRIDIFLSECVVQHQLGVNFVKTKVGPDMKLLAIGSWPFHTMLY